MPAIDRKSKKTGNNSTGGLNFKVILKACNFNGNKLPCFFDYAWTEHDRPCE